jgi:spore coat protein U-like protein
MLCRNTLLVLFSWLLTIPTATASTNPGSGSIAITMSIPSGCQISTSTASVNLGTYRPITTNKAAATVSAVCNLGSPNVTISLTSGNNPTATNGTGIMKSTSSSLTYHLFKDAAYTSPWGTGTNSLSLNTSVPNLGPYTVYASIDSNQFRAMAGSFTDTVTATVTY